VSRSQLELELKHSLARDYQFLVVAEQSGQLYHVRQYVLPRMGPDGSFVDDVSYGPLIDDENSAPDKTVGFDVHKYNPENGSLEYMDRSLDGLAFFIGPNNGFALSAAEYPELKPDSIYYTGMGSHDVGIFNYRDETFSPCFYPCDVQSVERTNGPMWFTPTPLVRFPFLVENDDGSLSCATSSFTYPSRTKLDETLLK
ncbi:hypothetical protein PHJA_002865500, partial [Phtheirospermum japonicum]